MPPRIPLSRRRHPSSGSSWQGSRSARVRRPGRAAGRAPVPASPGSSTRAPTAARAAPVCRRMVPRATPMTPEQPTTSAIPSSAGHGSPGRRFANSAVSSVREPTTQAIPAAGSATAMQTTDTTMACAAMSTPRRGVPAQAAAIPPLRCSAVTVTAPSPAAASIARVPPPTMLAPRTVSSGITLPVAPTTAARTGSAPMTHASSAQGARTERSRIHSAATASTSPARGTCDHGRLAVGTVAALSVGGVMPRLRTRPPTT